ncbi:MAG TPA: S9 family peptidase [Gemmatimonadales bacterium]|nr:S9 family peptidase [Gemmatimonadales bacterium]
MKRITTFWVTCLAFAALAPAAAQTPAAGRPMDYADIFRLATLQGAELSPDGAWVVYEVSKLQFPDWQRRTDLYLVSADGRTTRQLTYTEGEDETGARWQPRGGGAIGFVSSRDAKKRQLFLIRPDGGEARRVTNTDDGIGAWAWSRDGAWIAYIAGPEGKRQVWVLPGDGSGKAEQLTKHATSVETFAWSEDGRAIYFTASDEPDSTRRRRVKEKFDVRVMNEPAAATHLWALEVATKSEKRLTQGALRVTGVELSRDGRWAAFRGRPTDRYADDRATELYLVNLASGAMERLTENYVGEGAVSFSPDSRLIAFTADRDFHFGNLSRVYVRPVTGVKGDWRELGRGDARDLGVGFWSADGRTIYWNGDEGVNGNVYTVDVASGTVRPLTAVVGTATAVKGRDQEMALVRYTDPRSPPDLYFAPVAQLARRERWVRLTRLNPWVDSLSLGRYETVHWKAGDGTTVEGILVYPVGWERTRRYPLIVQLHGGPASAYQNSFSGGHGTYTHVLAGKGYAVLQPNYRGSTGYGEAFQTAIAGNYWPLAAEDILTGVDTLIGRGIASPDSLGMMGWSAGGHWSNWTLVTTDRFKAISSGAGVSNWISLYAQTDVQATREYYLGGDAGRDAANKPWDNFEHWWAESPLRYITRAKTPTLLHSGEKDERIPMPQNLELYMALKQRGVPTEFLVYPGQPHGLQEPRYQLVKMMAEIGWFERWIRGKQWFTWEELLATADRIAGKEAVSRQPTAVSRP